ncbi:MAG: primosomal protein N' [bacterium]|nr:primosomal protein N' [bacterium]
MAAVATLAEVALPVPLDQTFTYRVPDDWPAPPVRPGDLVSAPLGRRNVTGLVVGVREAAADVTEVDGHRLRPLRSRFPAAYRVEGDRRRLLDWMAGYYALPPGELVPLFHPPAPGTKARPRRAVAAYPIADAVDVQLTPDQGRAVDWAVERLEARRFGALLLHGVTGSGKTEVYLRVIAEALARGRSALYLLPEIALTPQTEARVAARFGARVATVHSGLSAGERCRVHEAAAAGELSVVLGPRSALFTPLRDLGVVIVDEEHDASYKQEEKPRYHARHAALVRAREAGACVVLGSATPDLESVRNAIDGRYREILLADRPVGEMPAVEIVDMRGGPASDGFSDALLTRLESCLAQGRQAILYYNRRGFARVLQCTACGVPVACPHCDIALTVHLRPRQLLCHYCGFARREPDTCPDCGGPSFLPGGSGTERLELALAAHFPDARVLRLDQDTTRARGSHRRILSDFAARGADILVGTQMVAKGHHFAGVDLVGVLAADDGLTLPDFRAHERVFQLLTQVAGRAGRESPGAVLFQTWQPDHPVIQAASRHDFAAFAAAELPQREAAGYPPARRMLRVGLAARRPADVQEAAHRFAGLMRAHLLPPDLEVLGPAPAVFARLQNRVRWQLLVKGTMSNGQRAWLADRGRRLAAETAVDVTLDVDPVGLY